MERRELINNVKAMFHDREWIFQSALYSYTDGMYKKYHKNLEDETLSDAQEYKQTEQNTTCVETASRDTIEGEQTTNYYEELDLQ